MKSTFKLIKRFVKILILSIIGLIILNTVLFIAIASKGTSNAGGWEAASQICAELTKSETGEYILSENGKEILKQREAWAILIEDGTGNVAWYSENLPEGIPMHYSASEISYYTRGYIKDYPTTTAAKGNDILFMGHPKNTYWKHMWPTFDYDMIANAPKTILIFLLVNALAVFAIYFASTSGILKSVKPIITGIEELPDGKNVYIREKGLLSELAAAINRVSEKLMIQDRALKKKETVRANWIAGVSHDIRTPLSMVMGYAGQLENDFSLSEQNRKKASVICRQSVRMKNLVNDLNLASKLEYKVYPIHLERVNLVAVVRKCAADFINLDIDEKFPICWTTENDVSLCFINGDKELLYRAVSNLINNSQYHNPDGCSINICVKKEDTEYCVIVEDNGVGITDEKLENLKNTPHYMISDGSTSEPRHGLGLLIVQQIAEAHGGSAVFDHGQDGGFYAALKFKIK